MGEFLRRERHEDGHYHCWISTDKVLNALRSGWDLKNIWMELEEIPENLEEDLERLEGWLERLMSDSDFTDSDLTTSMLRVCWTWRFCAATLNAPMRSRRLPSSDE